MTDHNDSAQAAKIAALIATLGDKNGTNWRTFKALGEIGAPAIPSLAAVFDNDNADWDIRYDAIEALGEIGTPEVVPILTAALGDEDEYVRVVSARMLQKIGPAAIEAVPALIRMLADDWDDARIAAINALTDIRSATKEVLSVLTCVSLTDKSFSVQNIAANALGEIDKPIPAGPPELPAVEGMNLQAEIWACAWTYASMRDDLWGNACTLKERGVMCDKLDALRQYAWQCGEKDFDERVDEAYWLYFAKVDLGAIRRKIKQMRSRQEKMKNDQREWAQIIINGLEEKLRSAEAK